MFERVTDKGRKIIVLAREEAERHQNDYLGTEHLVLAILRETDGVALMILKKMGLSTEQIRLEIERNLPGGGTTMTFGEIPFSPRVKKVIEYAVEEARLLGHNHIGGEHLLLGLLREEEGIGGKILRSLGANLLTARQLPVSFLRKSSPREAGRESHNPAGAAEGSIDASNMLKPALSRGEIQCIGATTLDEYRKHIEKDGALKRRFQPIYVQQPSVEETIRIIQGLRDRYESHHGVEITEEAIAEAVKLADRYITDRFFPDKAIDVIDETGSRAKLQAYALPGDLRAMEQELKKVSREKEMAIALQNFEEAVKFREEEERLRKLLEDSKREWKKSQEKSRPVIAKEDVSYVVSKMTGIPLFKLEEEESQKLLRMEEALHKRVVGQEEAVSAVARSIRRSRAGLKESKKPIGSFIFLGPTGVGKTELARALAESLFNTEDVLNRIDEVVVFHSLEKSHLVTIVDNILAQLRQRLVERGIELEVSDEVKASLIHEGYQPIYGARPMRRCIQESIGDPLSEELIKGRFREFHKIKVVMKGGVPAFVEEEALAGV